MNHSKALESAGYDPARSVLCLRFRTGGLYVYYDVPASVFDGLIASAHPWTEWQTRIRAYRYARL